MKKTFILLLLSVSYSALSETGIERLNFFPDVDQFGSVKYEYQRTLVESQERALNTNELNDYSNTLYLSYGHKFKDKYFFGITVPYQAASESGVRYAVPVSEKFRSHGFREPEVFTIIRLREETPTNGLLHLLMDYSNKIGTTQVGKDNSNRLKGRNVFRAEINHGRKQDLWEFKTYFRYEYFGTGKERDSFTEANVNHSSYNDMSIGFKAQYAYSEKLYFIGGIGFIYRGDREMSLPNGDNRELQAGTGSHFEFSSKYRFNEKNLVELGGSFERNDYFVSGELSNFDGEGSNYISSLNYIRIF